LNFGHAPADFAACKGTTGLQKTNDQEFTGQFLLRNSATGAVGQSEGDQLPRMIRLEDGSIRLTVQGRK
jgi:hypothetical protein